MSIIVRKVLPMEYHKYREHLKRLDADSKILRFGNHLSDTAIDKICDKIEQYPEHHILFCVEDADLNFVAVGHIAVEGGMELAFSVHKEYQKQGIGSKLMERCIQWCRTHNKLRGTMMCLSRNSAIKHLCVKHGIRLHTDYDETFGNVELTLPDITTYVKENIDSNLGIFDYLSKRTCLFWSFLPEKA